MVDRMAKFYYINCMNTKYTRKELKAHPVYIAFNNDFRNPSKYLEQLDLTIVKDRIIYYWICEDDMTLINDKQKDSMDYCFNDAMCSVV